MTGVIIVGTGDHARVAMDTALALGLDVTGFLEPDENRIVAPIFQHLPVFRGIQAMVDHQAVQFIVAVGDNRIRAEIFKTARSAGCRPVTLIHPSAVVLSGAEIGAGSHVCAAAVIGVDARVGSNVIVNTGATIDHDGLISDHAFVGPGSHLAGRVVVEEGAHIGLGSSVIERRRIGAWSYVAAGAVVTRDVASLTRVAGIPAQPMRHANGTREGE